MKKYKFITSIDARKIVVDDLDNDRATIYWHNGRIEKNANYRYNAEEYKDSWFDSLDDCCYDRLAEIYYLWEEGYEPYSEYLQAREEEEQVVGYLHGLVQDNPLDEIYKD